MEGELELIQTGTELSSDRNVKKIKILTNAFLWIRAYA